MNDNRTVALFDMDGTVCNYVDTLQIDLEKLRGPNEEEVKNFLGRLPDHIFRRAVLIKSKPGWWTNLERIDLGCEMYELCKNIGFETHVLTKGPVETTGAWTEKVQWCYDNLDPNAKVTITQDKGLVYGKVLFDDYPLYITKWLAWRKNGTCFMPDRPWNKDFYHPQVIRYNAGNREEVRMELIKIFKKNNT